MERRIILWWHLVLFYTLALYLVLCQLCNTEYSKLYSIWCLNGGSIHRPAFLHDHVSRLHIDPWFIHLITYGDWGQACTIIHNYGRREKVNLCMGCLKLAPESVAMAMGSSRWLDGSVWLLIVVYFHLWHCLTVYWNVNLFILGIFVLFYVQLFSRHRNL